MRLYLTKETRAESGGSAARRHQSRCARAISAPVDAAVGERRSASSFCCRASSSRRPRRAPDAPNTRFAKRCRAPTAVASARRAQGLTRHRPGPQAELVENDARDWSTPSKPPGSSGARPEATIESARSRTRAHRCTPGPGAREVPHREPSRSRPVRSAVSASPSAAPPAPSANSRRAMAARDSATSGWAAPKMRTRSASAAKRPTRASTRSPRRAWIRPWSSRARARWSGSSDAPVLLVGRDGLLHIAERARQVAKTGFGAGKVRQRPCHVRLAVERAPRRRMSRARR